MVCVGARRARCSTHDAAKKGIARVDGSHPRRFPSHSLCIDFVFTTGKRTRGGREGVAEAKRETPLAVSPQPPPPPLLQPSPPPPQPTCARPARRTRKSCKTNQKSAAAMLFCIGTYSFALLAQVSSIDMPSSHRAWRLPLLVCRLWSSGRWGVERGHTKKRQSALSSTASESNKDAHAHTHTHKQQNKSNTSHERRRRGRKMRRKEKVRETGAVPHDKKETGVLRRSGVHVRLSSFG